MRYAALIPFSTNGRPDGWRDPLFELKFLI
jgi:hypothetical protein